MIRIFSSRPSPSLASSALFSPQRYKRYKLYAPRTPEEQKKHQEILQQARKSEEERLWFRKGYAEGLKKQVSSSEEWSSWVNTRRSSLNQNKLNQEFYALGYDEAKKEMQAACNLSYEKGFQIGRSEGFKMGFCKGVESVSKIARKVGKISDQYLKLLDRFRGKK